MISIRLKPLAALLPALFPFAAHSQEISQTPAVMVTATRQAQRVDESIATVTLLERSDIEQAGPASTLGELLGTIPGIEFNRAGGRGSEESVYLRGTNSGHALILVDGMRIGSATYGTTSLQMIPLNQVERIEILRGPASAIYGSDAIGGVIQVFTRKGKDVPLLAATIGTGTQGSYETSLAHGNRIGNFCYSLKTGTTGTSGINSILTAGNPAYNPDKDGYSARNFGLDMAYKLDPRLEVGAGYLNSFSKAGYDAYQTLLPSYLSVNADLNYKMRHETTGANVYARVMPLDAWTSTLRIAQGLDRTESPASIVGDPLNVFKTTQNQYSWQNDIRLPVGQALLLVERLEQEVAATRNYSQRSRTIDSLALGWNGRLGNHSLQVNFRSDENSQFGTHDTYLLGYGYRLNPGWNIAASYGTAFKAPTMNDLYFPITPGAGGGNPNLAPEKSTSAELALRYETAGLRGSVTYFDNRIKNLIDWANTSADPMSYYYTPTNIGKVRINGVEIAAGTTLGRWKLDAALTLQDPRDEQTDEQLRRRAKYFGRLAAVYNGGAYSIGSELKFVGKRYDDPHYLTHLNQVEMGAYEVLNLFADYRINRSLQAFARIDNLFDRHYEVAKDTTTAYGVPGVSAFAGLRYTFE